MIKIKLIVNVMLLIASISYSASAATVDTISIFSSAMHKNFKCIVITPKAYQNKKIKFPVVYLLHGYSGDYSDWVKKAPALLQCIDEDSLIAVCPDGGYSSWYFDSPVDTTMRYETYIGTEVPEYIDAYYRTIANRNARAITGLSMGGHGALFIAFRHQNEFGACGSMSGGVDLHASHNQFEISKRIGDTLHYADNWNKYSVVNVVENYPEDSLAIIFDCGINDFFYDCNRRLHQKLLRLHIPHDYTERPGGHTWNYWNNAVKYQLLFFREYFKKNPA